MSAHANRQTDEKQEFLSKDVNQAVRQLIALSKDLIHFAEVEQQSLITLDHMKFAFAQRDKEILSERYARASEEFRGRLGAFRMADKNLIAQLNSLQSELKEISENNNVLIDQIKRKAAANTQTTLFTAQQMGQRVRIHEADTKEEHNNERR